MHVVAGGRWKVIGAWAWELTDTRQTCCPGDKPCQPKSLSLYQVGEGNTSIFVLDDKKGELVYL